MIRDSKKPAPARQRGHPRLKRDLMSFWGMHSTGRFDGRAICCALDHDLPDVERELQVLVEMAIVERETENGVPLYWLTPDENKRQPIVEWARPGHIGR